MIWPWDWLFGFIPIKDEALRKFIPKKNFYWTSSARNALYLILNYIKKSSNKQLTIAIPAFTCQVIKDSAKRAKYKVIYYDSGIVASVEDIQSVLENKPDIIILSYNFGYLPDEINKIVEMCKKYNIIIIEDCAQALGAKQKGKLAGSFGDYVIYSFGISKNIGFDGGLVASDEKLVLKNQKNMPFIKLLSSILQSIIGPLLLTKLFFPISNHIMKKKLEKIKKYPLKNYSLPIFIRNIICHLAKKYEKVLKKRQENYKIITGVDSEDACLYFPIVDNIKEIKQCAATKGIELENMKSFNFLPNDSQKKEFPKAARISENHLSFALFRSKKDIDKIKEVIGI